MPTRNVVLTEHHEKLIEELVSSGRFQNASEVLRAGLRLIEREQAVLGFSDTDERSRFLEQETGNVTSANPEDAPDGPLLSGIPPDLRAVVEKGAALNGQDADDFIIASAYDAAIRAIVEKETIILDKEESRAFAEALLNPREPVEALKKAAQRYIKLYGR
jgi:putative addiction module CopG family antidote